MIQPPANQVIVRNPWGIATPRVLSVTAGATDPLQTRCLIHRILAARLPAQNRRLWRQWSSKHRHRCCTAAANRSKCRSTRRTDKPVQLSLYELTTQFAAWICSRMDVEIRLAGG